MVPLLQAQAVWNAGMRQQVSFSLASGQVVLIQGPSGSGKSRLLRALADLDPHEGSVTFQGKAQADFSPCQWRRQVMYCPAQPAWWAEIPAACFDVVSDAALLAAVGLSEDKLQQPVASLSSGELQRLGLLRALVRQPHVLLLDEPTSHLDAGTAETVTAFLLEWVQQAPDRGLVWVSHAPQEQQSLQRHGAQILKVGDVPH